MFRASSGLRSHGSQNISRTASGDRAGRNSLEELDYQPGKSAHMEPVRRERGQITLRRADSQAYHIGSLVWVPERSPEQGLGKQKVLRWVKGQVAAVGRNSAGETVLSVQTEEGLVREHRPEDLPLQNERDDTVDDLVKSDFLHEPGYVAYPLNLPCLAF